MDYGLIALVSVFVLMAFMVNHTANKIPPSWKAEDDNLNFWSK